MPLFSLLLSSSMFLNNLLTVDASLYSPLIFLNFFFFYKHLQLTGAVIHRQTKELSFSMYSSFMTMFACVTSSNHKSLFRTDTSAQVLAAARDFQFCSSNCRRYVEAAHSSNNLHGATSFYFTSRILSFLSQLD
jgi:hypothetical protein